MNEETVLCVVAHPDDEVLGVGGTLAAHSAAGHEVNVCILSDGVTSRHEEITEEANSEIKRRTRRAQLACDRLGVSTVSIHSYPDNQFDTVPLLDIVKTIEGEINEIKPTVVYTQHYGDLNIDHELTCRATMTATRPLKESPVQRVLAFETLSSSEWGTPKSSATFQPTTFIDISEYLKQKLDAIKVYEGELRGHPHPRTVQNVRKNAELWGAKSGLESAEPFEVLREIRTTP